MRGPRSLMPAADVAAAPGRSSAVKRPFSQMKPWNVPSAPRYSRTTRRWLLMPKAVIRRGAVLWAAAEERADGPAPDLPLSDRVNVSGSQAQRLPGRLTQSRGSSLGGLQVAVRGDAPTVADQDGTGIGDFHGARLRVSTVRYHRDAGRPRTSPRRDVTAAFARRPWSLVRGPSGHPGSLVAGITRSG